jgi:SAM-dependent methyltransferase
MSDAYDNPEYYEIAFSFRDIAKEVDVFEECFRQFADVPVKSVLELACGNSPHMEELVRRGYEYTGLDLNEEMLAYSRKKAVQAGVKVNLVRGDMIDFSFGKQFDFAYVMLGSLFVTSTVELIRHFGSVARTLKKGGLYLLDWCIQFEPPWQSKGGSSWEIERGGIKVKTTVTWEPVNLVRQLFKESIKLEVDDHGKTTEICGSDIRRAIYPQEFLRFISGLDDFEFVGWWNNWNLSEPLEHAKNIARPIAVVKRI